jgi:thymidylate synthase ThyX
MTISAKVVADSVSATSGARLTTFELEYPRFVHAEFMTHRLFSRNAASSRAIPVKRAIELILENTAKPIHWGKNQPGMSAKEECEARIGADSEFYGYTRQEWWEEARDAAILHAQGFDRSGYHKQIVNRLLEPYSHIKVICSATEFDNFFHLRRHPDAQPEIRELADQMWLARENSMPVPLDQGEWHLPYFRDEYTSGFWTERQKDITSLEDAISISASCCAQVSYRKLDDSLEKARDIYKRLVESQPVHASPFEHQATPIEYGPDAPSPFEIKGVTHFTNLARLGLPESIADAWSGNFRGWVQHRHLIPDNTKWRYVG